MGCTQSASPQDPQAMLEKQRQIMLQRQREFEEKRSQQSAGSARPTPVDTDQSRGKSKDHEPHSAQSAASAAARKEPHSANAATRDRSASSQRPPGDSVGKNSTQSAASSAMPGDSKEKRLVPPSPAAATTVTAPSSTLAPLGVGDEGFVPPIDEATKRKYTINNEDADAAAEKRKSKNMHDFGQFMGGAKAVRRASFNPAAAAASAATTSHHNNGPPPALPHRENSKEAMEHVKETIVADLNPVVEEVGRLTVTEDGRSIRETFVAPAGDVIGEDGSLAYGTAAVPDGIDAPQLSEERAAKFVARDPNDRRSKNLHDLGQYMAKGKDFARRTSFQPSQPAMLSADEAKKLEEGE